jgi:hypothetical protein
MQLLQHQSCLRFEQFLHSALPSRFCDHLVRNKHDANTNKAKALTMIVYSLKIAGLRQTQVGVGLRIMTTIKKSKGINFPTP